MINLQAHLIQPSEKYKQRTFAGTLKRPKEIKKIDLDKIKSRLKKNREDCLSELHSSIKKIKKKFKDFENISTHWANTAEQASKIIREISGDRKYLNINKSGTIKEIEPDLKKEGFELKNSYLTEYDSDIKGKFQFFWQQPEFKYNSIENWFDNTEHVDLAGSDSVVCYDLVSLIGVNALSAETGNVYLLQHTSNITQLLHAKRVIVLLALEKIVPTDKDAAFQTKWAGIFGLEKIILDLAVPAEKDKTVFEKIKPLSGGLQNKLSQKVDIIILDNGRKKLLDSPFRDLMKCISCRSCRNRCPNYPYFGKYRGYYPQLYCFSYLMGENPSIDLCAQCGNCSPECPVGIDVAWMIAQAKSLPGATKRTIGDLMFSRLELLGKLSCAGAPISGWTTKQPAIRHVMEKLVGIPKKRTLPTANKVWKPTVSVKNASGIPIIYFMGCNAKYFETSIADAAVKLLKANGFTVIVPDFNCCGRAAVSSGGLNDLKKYGQYNIKKLLEYEKKGIDIVATCPTCAYALKHDYSALGINGANHFSERIYDLGHYLWRLHVKGKLKTRFDTCKKRFAYHKPCHLYVEMLEYETADLMALVPQLAVVPINKGCCGMMGSFGQKLKNYQYSMTTGEPGFKMVIESDTTEILTECNLCKLQLIDGTNKVTRHPIEVLADLINTNE
jgi:glycerol-3-phosphate dehydrogenase subunit C